MNLTPETTSITIAPGIQGIKVGDYINFGETHKVISVTSSTCFKVRNLYFWERWYDWLRNELPGEPNDNFLCGFNDGQEGQPGGVRITEFSLDAKTPNLFELNGEPVESDHPDACHHGDTAGGICLDCGHDTDGDQS